MVRGEVTEKDDAALFTEILGRAVGALERCDVPYATFGSLASNVYGRPTCSPAQSNDYVVPERIIRDLFDVVFPPRSEPSGEAYGQTG